MSASLPRYTGSCLCGGVRYELTAELGAIEVCYCRPTEQPLVRRGVGRGVTGFSEVRDEFPDSFL